MHFIFLNETSFKFLLLLLLKILQSAVRWCAVTLHSTEFFLSIVRDTRCSCVHHVHKHTPIQTQEQEQHKHVLCTLYSTNKFWMVDIKLEQQQHHLHHYRRCFWIWCFIYIYSSKSRIRMIHFNSFHSIIHHTEFPICPKTNERQTFMLNSVRACVRVCVVPPLFPKENRIKVKWFKSL